MKNFFKILTASLIFGIVIFASSCDLKEIAKQNVWVEKDVSYTVSDVEYTVSTYMLYNDGSYSTDSKLQDDITLGNGWNIFMVFTCDSSDTTTAILKNKWLFKNFNGTIDLTKEDSESTVSDDLSESDEEKMTSITFDDTLWSLFYIPNYTTFEKSATSSVPSEMLSKNASAYTKVTDLKNISLKKILANILLDYLDQSKNTFVILF